MRLSLPDLASLRPLRPQGGRLGLVLLCLWALGGILSLSLPRAQLSERTARYYKYYGSYIEYENQQRAYEQQYNNNNNNNNNNNDDYNYVPDCKWFQWQCRKQMVSPLWRAVIVTTTSSCLLPSAASGVCSGMRLPSHLQ